MPFLRRAILYTFANSAVFGPEGTLIDREWLHFSAGKLPLSHRLTATRVPGDPDKVEVTWQYDRGIRIASSEDVVQLPAVTGAIQGVYLFFGSEKSKLYSPDLYFGI